MLRDEQLSEAISRGIIQPEQAKALRKLAAESGNNPKEELIPKVDLDAGDDESFRFISGFNDIFLALGVVTLLYGMGLSGLSSGIRGHLIAAVVSWVLAEIFAGWLKRSLPSMIVATTFVYHILGIASLYLYGMELGGFSAFNLFDTSFDQRITWQLMITGIVASLLLYARFKLPFSLFLAGIQIVGLVIVETLKMLDGQTLGYVIPLLFATGLLLFAAAMWFDTADPLRMNRLSDNAFWLHLLASPLIVHSIMWQSAIWIIGNGDVNFLSLSDIAPTLAIVVLAIFLCLMVVALIIDRRAMLVSSLVYVSVAVAWIIAQQGNVLNAASFTPVLIGSAIIALGVGWRPLRRMIFTILSLGFIEARLPPVRN